MESSKTSAIPADADLTRADSLAREIFAEVANKWAFLIIEFLGQRTMRFSELRDAIGDISHKMLTQNLRMLEYNGLVHRTIHPTVPPRVEYTLTEAGEGLQAVVGGMCGWTQQTCITSKLRVSSSATRAPVPAVEIDSGHSPEAFSRGRRSLPPRPDARARPAPRCRTMKPAPPG